MYKSSQTGIADIEILPGNIMNVTIRKGAEVTIDNARRMVKHINGMLDPEIELRAGIFDISNVTYINEEAREYLVSGEDTTGTTVALAMISSSMLGRLIGNLFLTLTDQGPIPVKFFESPIRAEHWVRTCVRNFESDTANQRQVA